MLNFVLGRAGSGKSTYLQKKLRDFALAGADGMTLLVPEQASFVTEREMLGLLGAENADKVEVLSFTRLAENLLAGSGEKKLAHLDDGGRAVIMSLAMEAVSDKLKVYKNHSRSISVVNEMLKLSDEFKRCAVPPLEIQKAGGAIGESLLKSKLLEISVVFEAYDALVADSFEDDRELLTRLEKQLSESGYFDGKIVAIDEFSGFTRQEYIVIERILARAKDVYVTLCTDSIYPNASGGALEYSVKTAQRLINAAKRANVPVASPVTLSNAKFGKTAALSALDDSLFNSASPVFSEDAKEITVCAAPEVYSECAYVASEIKRLLREENYRCREIAVIARSIENYESSLKTAMRKCDVPVFEDMRQPVVTQPLIGFLRACADIASEGFNCDRVMRALKTGLTELAAEEIFALENYALMWDIGGDKWLSDWQYNPRGFGKESTQDDMAVLEEINIIRSKAVKPLAKFRDFVRDTDGIGYAGAMYELLENVGAADNLKIIAAYLNDGGEKVLALEQERLWDMTMEILDLLALTVGKRKLSAKRFAELLDIIISTRTLGNIPQGLDEVAIGGADRIVTSSPKAVFIIGANDGEFPKDPVMRGILNDNDRKKLADLGLELYDFGEDRVISERFLAYKAICCASERVYVSYHSCDSDGSQTGASEIVMQIKRGFPGLTSVSAAELQETTLPEGTEPAFEMVCLLRRDEGKTYHALRCWLEKDEAYKSKLEALDRAAMNSPMQINDKKTAEQLFGKNLFISPTSAEKFYSCPFSYYCEFGLLAKPAKKAEFDPRQQGTEIHFVLEKILRENGKDGLIAMTPQQRAEKVKKILDEYLISRLGGTEKPKRFEYLYSRLAKTICEILERLVMEFSVCSFVPVDFELRINSDGDIPTYDVTSEDGSRISIAGVVDRVDKFEIDGKTFIRVIDYKSGEKTFQLSDVMGGLNLQMVLYLFAIWENGGDRYGEVVPSGILYMPAKAKFTGTQRDSDEQTVKLQKAKGLKMSGMVLKNDSVVLAMDSTGTGVFVPAYFTAKEELKGTLISLEQMKKLREKTDSLLGEMADMLHDGKIEALPVGGSTHKDTCRYCAYKAACFHEDDSPVREVASFTHGDALQLLKNDDD